MKTQIPASGGAGLGRGGRMWRQRKRDTVLRMLRGEDLETLSRALGGTAATLTGWQATFLAAGEASLATRSVRKEPASRIVAMVCRDRRAWRHSGLVLRHSDYDSLAGWLKGALGLG